MTNPGSIGNNAPRTDDWIVKELQSLRSLINTVRAARTLQNASIDAGGLTVQGGGSITLRGGGSMLVQDGGGVALSGGGVITVDDDTGSRHVTIGLQSDSSYGLSVTDPVSGNTLPLSQLAFGLSAASDPTAVSAGTKGTWTADGLSVNVTVASGRMLVLAGATLTMGTPTGANIAHSYYGFNLSGPTNVAASTTSAVHSEFGSFDFQGMFASVVTGLTNGSYTVAGSVMRTTSGTDAPPTVSASVRSLIVLPF